MIVDEVQIGFGVIGKFWGYQYWNLISLFDIVIFFKKVQIVGYLFGDSMLVLDKVYCQFNIWIGDLVCVMMSKVVIKEILDKNLVEQIVCVGDILYFEISKFVEKYFGQIQNF